VLGRFTVGVHFVNVDACDPRIHWVIVEQVQEIHMSPHIIADGNNLVYDNTGTRPFPRDLAEIQPERDRTVWDERVMLNLSGAEKPRRSFLRLLLVDHQFVEFENVVLIANRATIVNVHYLDHE
jgi:hypothetical protein